MSIHVYMYVQAFQGGISEQIVLILFPLLSSTIQIK